MKRIASILTCVILTFNLCRCSDQYDDSALWEQIGDIKSQVDRLSREIGVLGLLINAAEAGLQVLNIIDTGQGSKIVFSNGSSIVILDGSDGAGGSDASPGADAPVIGVGEYGGDYYWTLTLGEDTDWLRDGTGNRIPVTGRQGRTPELSVDGNNYWIVDGQPLAGPDGSCIRATGKDGHSLFKGIEQTDSKVVITLADGTEIVLDKFTDVVFNLGTGSLVLGYGESERVDIIQSGVKYTSVTRPEGWRAELFEDHLLVTAPNRANLHAEPSGEVSVLAVGDAGNTVAILKVNVEEVLYDTWSNSFIVSPGDVCAISVEKAYTMWESNEYLAGNRAELTGEVAAHLIWQEKPGMVERLTLAGSGRSAVIRAYTSGQEGNAVVAVSVGGIIRWSWHLWITSYDPELEGNSVYYNNSARENTFMDRNLGAISASPGDIDAVGLYYQWGRKDPFPGITDWQGTTKEVYSYDGSNSPIEYAVPISSSTAGHELENLTTAILHPSTFLSGRSDWYTGAVATYLWESEGDAKSVFDPCPWGWKVPPGGLQTVSPWLGFSFDRWDNGPLSNIGYYPAGGYKEGSGNSAGSFVNVGNNVWVWHSTAYTASTYSYNAYTLWVNSASTIRPGYTQTKACGNNIRCVRQ